ncbi:MAG: DMT family transporter [Chloroflexia bacterium]
MFWILASAAAFGALGIFGKLAYAGGLGLPTLLAARFGLAAVLMWAIVAVRGLSPRVSLRTLVGLLLMGAVGYVGQAFSYFTALLTIQAATTGLLLYTYPSLVALLAWLLLRQKLTRAGAIALLMATVGCALVLGGLAALPGRADSAGVAWGLAAALIYSLYIIAGARLTASVQPLVASAYIITAAAVVFWVGGLLGGTLDFRVTAGGWAAVVGMALICTVLAIAAFVTGLAQVGPARASILSTVEPVITMLLAVLVLGEQINAGQILGGGLILGAVFVLRLGARG